MLPTFTELRRRGFRLGVISNFDERLPRLLDALGLAAHLDAAVHSSAVGVEKPHPAIFEQLLHDLELPPAAVVHVGDSRRDDVEGAQAIGLHGLLLDRRGHGDLARLDELLDQLDLA